MSLKNETMIRKTLTIVALLFIVCLNSSGQEIDSIKNKGVKITLDGPIRNLGDPIFVLSIDKLKGEFTKSELFRDSLSINPDWIISINVLKGKEAIDKYGARGQYGAILIDLKKDSLGKLSADIKSKLETKN